jgi:hypothetical protein
MTWCSKLKSGDELLVGGGLIIRFDRDVVVELESVEGKPRITIEKRRRAASDATHSRPDRGVPGEDGKGLGYAVRRDIHVKPIRELDRAPYGRRHLD